MKRWNSTNLPIFLLFYTAFILFGGIQSAAIGLENTPNRVETGYIGFKAGVYAEETTDQKFYVSKDELSWFSANYFCRSKGWHLISTKDLEESVQLYGFLQFNKLTVGRYWTSGNRLADRRSWYWNLHNEAMGYTNWAPNYPETEKAQYCMQLSGILWYSYDCERLSKYICKKN